MVFARWSRLRVSQLAFCRHSDRKSFSPWSLARPDDLREIDLVDEHAGQRLGIELDGPTAVAGRAHLDIGDDGVGIAARQSAMPGRGSSARISASMSRRSSSSTPQMRFSVAKSRRARRSRLLEQRPHRRVEPVALGKLQRKAFGEVAREEPDRLERLADGRAPPRYRPRRRLAARQFRPWRHAYSRRRRDCPPVRGRSAATPDREKRRRSARRHDRAGWSPRPPCRPWSKPSAEPPAALPLPADFHCAVRSGPSRSEVPGSSGKMFSSELSSLSEMASDVQAGSFSNQSPSAELFLLSATGRSRRPRAARRGRAGDCARSPRRRSVELHMGQLQQLDGLHQLRRHHQRLRLPQLKFGRQSHYCELEAPAYSPA